MTDSQSFVTSNADTATRQQQKFCQMNLRDEMQMTR